MFEGAQKMPLRDHFRPPLDSLATWEGFHGQWPAVIVQHLRKQLPPAYTAEPRVHSGSQVEVDIAAFEKDEFLHAQINGSGGGVATTVWAPPQPTVSVETKLAEYDEYEVRIYDARKGRHLVAAIEIVSPANKDRSEHRNIFVAKCAALLQKGVAVSIIDLVTVLKFNLYADLLTFIGHADPTFGESPPLYAASCRLMMHGERTILQAWSYELTIGQALPTLPLWLSSERAVPLDLESSYEQACHDLWIA